MPFLIGLGLALAVAVFARFVGFDRDRAFYSTVLMIVGSYYVLFAVMGGSTRTVVLESLVMSVFVAAAVVGFKSSVWFVIAGLFMHGVFDAVHGRILQNAGMPVWWPAFCGAYDVAAAAGLAWLSIGGAVGRARQADSVSV